MAIAFQLAVGAADYRNRRVVAVVSVAIAHAASEVDQRAIQKCAIAVGRRLELTDELGEFRHLIGCQLGVLLNGLGLVAMVRDRMMGLRNADMGIAAAASFMTYHEGE